MQKIFLIRHGQTTGDVEDRYGGAYDDLLSPEGEQQAIQLSVELKDHGIQQIFSSPLKRAQQTAQALADITKYKVVTIDGLRERDQYGLLTGMIKSDASKKYPGLVEQVKNRLNTLPNAESYNDASQRTIVAYNHIMTQLGSCAAVIWHGGGMRILFRDILKVGELKTIGDCCWVELHRDSKDSEFEIGKMCRIELH